MNHRTIVYSVPMASMQPKYVNADIFNLTVVGTIIGILMPQNESLPTPWYRLLSSITGAMTWKKYIERVMMIPLQIVNQLNLQLRATTLPLRYIPSSCPLFGWFNCKFMARSINVGNKRREFWVVRSNPWSISLLVVAHDRWSALRIVSSPQWRKER